MRFLAGVIAVASVIVLMASAHRALAEEEGRYQVVVGGATVIMVDTRTGISWSLIRPGPPTWRPILYEDLLGGLTILPIDEATTAEEQKRQGQIVDEFNHLVEAGRGSLSGIETLPDAGSNHLAGGQQFRYPSEFPTSGPHDPNLLGPGFYSDPQRSERLVHSLEHGMVVMYYDEPGRDVINTLRDWTSRFLGPWSGVIAVRRPGLGQEVVLTAWQRLFRLDPFEPAAAAAFVDLFRGRGPEQQVR